MLKDKFDRVKGFVKSEEVQKAAKELAVKIALGVAVSVSVKLISDQIVETVYEIRDNNNLAEDLAEEVEEVA